MADVLSRAGWDHKEMAMATASPLVSTPEGLTLTASWGRADFGTISQDELLGSVARDGVVFVSGSGLFLTLFSCLAVDQNPPPGSSHSSTRPSLQELRRETCGGGR